MYERKFNKDDPSGANDYDTMRDLPKVWASTRPAAARGFTERNTVTLDDSERKMREFPDNVLVLPEYDEASVLKGEDEALDYAKAYLDMLLDEEGDVRETLGERPFRVGFL